MRVEFYHHAWASEITADEFVHQRFEVGYWVWGLLVRLVRGNVLIAMGTK